MKNLFLTLAMLAVCGGTFAADGEESLIARQTKTRTLISRLAPSAVTVKVRFTAPDEDSGDIYRMPYLCPNCNRTHYNTVKELAENDTPLCAAGYVIAPDRVLMQDLCVRSNFVASVTVDAGGRSYAAMLVKRYPAQGAVELQTAQPIVGAQPLEFKAGGQHEVTQFFFSVCEKGQNIAGVTPAGALPLRFYPGLKQDVVKVPGNAVALDKAGEPVSLSFRSQLPLTELVFSPPATWKGEAPFAFDERLAALEKRLRESVVPVFIHREIEKRSAERRGRITFRDDDDDEAKTDFDGIGYALENGELLVPLALDASKTAEIEKMEAILPDGSRKALEYVGAFDRPALAVLRFPDGTFPAGIRPLAFDGRKPEECYLSTLFTVSARNLDGRLSLQLTPEKVVEFDVLRGGVCAPDVRLSSSNGQLPFAVTMEGAFVLGAFPLRGRNRWSTDNEGLVAADLSALLKKRAFNPEFALRKGKDRIRVAWIGVETQTMTTELAREKKVTGLLKSFRTRGALVGRVHAKTPAAQAGLREGDVLLYVKRVGEAKREALESQGDHGIPLGLEEILNKMGAEHLGMVDADRFAPWPDVESGVNEIFSRFGIGAEVVVAWARAGELKEAKLVLARAPLHFRSAKRLKAKEMGAVFAELTFEVRGYYKLADDAPGIVVCKVQPGNPAAVAGLKPLELVTHVDNVPVKDLKSFGDLVRGKREFSLSLRRLETTRVIRITLQGKDADK